MAGRHLLIIDPVPGIAVLGKVDERCAALKRPAVTVQLIRSQCEIQPGRSAICTTGGERPAECSELIALLPGGWDDAKAVWVAFHGIDGTVGVDVKNMLEITWDTGQWSRKLPVGYWVVEHPAPGAVQAGDTVLVLKKPIGTAPTGGASVS